MGRAQRSPSPMTYRMSFALLSSSYEQTGQNLRRGAGLALCVLRCPPPLEEPPQAASRAPRERSYLNAINTQRLTLSSGEASRAACRRTPCRYAAELFRCGRQLLAVAGAITRRHRAAHRLVRGRTRGGIRRGAGDAVPLEFLELGRHRVARGSELAVAMLRQRRQQKERREAIGRLLLLLVVLGGRLDQFPDRLARLDDAIGRDAAAMRVTQQKTGIRRDARRIGGGGCLQRCRARTRYQDYSGRHAEQRHRTLRSIDLLENAASRDLVAACRSFHPIRQFCQKEIRVFARKRIILTGRTRLSAQVCYDIDLRRMGRAQRSPSPTAHS